MAFKIVSKITAQSVFGKIRFTLNDVKERKKIKLFRVVGLASSIETGKSQFGDWYAFLGSFSATNVETGEVFRSSKCFLPGPATDLLVPIVKEHGETTPIEFGFDVYAIAMPDRIDAERASYEYEVTTLMEPEQNDPLKLLEAKHLEPKHAARDAIGSNYAPVEAPEAEEHAEVKAKKK